MIDPILSLALSMHSNKGVYALLLGSGVSRSAQIPTAWEIVVDLIQKLARLTGEECGSDPAEWYERKFGKAPDYSNLLDAIAKSPSERRKLVSGYIEPTEDEREQRIKTPTVAHTSIAKLIANGYIRVIVTTNFDRLTEQALEELGIIPTVLSTSDQLKGAIPLVHSQCTIVKINGDYVDTRIKNTTGELSQYEPSMNELLDRILDEYGLVVCGWSAEWDLALRASLERCKGHRYTTYWCTRGPLNNLAKTIAGSRRAEIVTIENADAFFLNLSDKIKALEDIGAPHPLSVKAATASLKRYLADDRSLIRAHDLVMNETEAAVERLSPDHFPISKVRWSEDEFHRRVKEYELSTTILRTMLAIGVYWGKDEHRDFWKKSIERCANSRLSGGGLVTWIKLQSYPATLLLYSCGIAAVASGNLETLWKLFIGCTFKSDAYEEEQPIIFSHNVLDAMPSDEAKLLPGMSNHYTPLSDYLYEFLRETFRELIPDDQRYENCFDEFEYLLALTYLYLRAKSGKDTYWAPVGRFGWKIKKRSYHVDKQIERQVEEQGDQWRVLLAGFFEGSMGDFLKAREALRLFVNKLPWW